jgi:hypothetical protein
MGFEVLEFGILAVKMSCAVAAWTVFFRIAFGR